MTIDKDAIRNRIMKEASERAEKEIQDETMKETVLAALAETGIEGFYCGAGYMHTYGAAMHVDIDRETLPEAIELAEKLNPLPMYLKREGGTSFLPEGAPELSKRAGNNPAWQAANPMKEPELVQPYAYKIDGLLRYPETKTLFFFAKVAGYVVRFDVHVKNDSLTRRIYRVIEGKGHSRVENQGLKNESGYFPRSMRFWSSDENPAPYIAY